MHLGIHVKVEFFMNPSSKQDRVTFFSEKLHQQTLPDAKKSTTGMVSNESFFVVGTEDFYDLYPIFDKLKINE